MKTPREILLAQHRAAQPKLDVLRQSVVDELNRPIATPHSFPATFVSSLLGYSKTLWHELFLPSRRTWAGLATAWILLIAVNMVLRDQSPATDGKPVTMAAMISYGEQQKLLKELFADRSPSVDADRPKNYSPKPRTEKIQFFMA